MTDGLGELCRTGLIQTDFYRDLFAFGRYADPTTIPEEFRSVWSQLHEQPDLANALHAFGVISSRWRRLSAKWQRTQEVFAIACSHALATGVIPDDNNIIGSLCEMLEMGHDDIHGKLTLEAEKQHTELTHGSLLYRRAVEYFTDTARDSRPYATLVLALAASRFPYHACDLIEMPEADFENWITGGHLDIDARLERLRPHAAVASKFDQEPRVAEELLHVASGMVQDPPALSPQSHLYGAWVRQCLWGASLIEEAVGDRAEWFLSGDILKNHKRDFDDDRTREIRMAGNTPNYVFERDRKVVTPPSVREHFEQNFCDQYSVHRTIDFLGVLRERFGDS